MSEDKKVADFLEDVRELAVVAGEECPEGHRKDPSSGRCLPMGSTDHTAFTRSQNVDYGPEWRGEKTKSEKDTFANEQEVSLDADDMDEPGSCAEGTTFSFIQRRCISLDDAELEDDDEFAMTDEGLYVEDARNGHEEVISNQPEGRRDTVNHECPSNQFFDYKRRECIPLNKDTVLASESVGEEFKAALASNLSGKVGVTSPDPRDGHKHLVTLDEKGNGNTSICACYENGETYYHSHTVAGYLIKDYSSGKYTSQHFGHVVPQEVWEYEGSEEYDSVPVAGSEDSDIKEEAAPLKGGQRTALPDSAFGVPSKRKFPLDTCGRVRNAMARFNQGKGLTPGEKATLRRKILSKAKGCGIEVKNFGKANTSEEFAAVVQELITMETKNNQERLETYRAEAQGRGPCPPGMKWDAAENRCGHTRGFVEELANHSDIVKHQPEGRRDPVGFNCPPGEFYDYTNRRCLPLDPSRKPGTTTTKAEDEDAAQRDLTAQPSGRPVRLPIDCPKDTIWNKDRNECIPLDSSKKTKSSEEEDAAMPDFIKKMMDKKKGKDGDDKKDKKGKKAPPFGKKSKSEEEEEEAAMPDFIKKMMDKKKGKDGKDGDDKKKKGKKGGFPFDKFKKKSKSDDEDAQTTSVGPGKEEDDHGCDTATETYNVKTERCEKSRTAKADAKPALREGLTPAPAGKVQHQSDCPPNTAWDAKNKICRPIDSMAKDRPSGASPQSPKSTADKMTIAQLIQALDEIVTNGDGNKEKSKVSAKDLPNAAFPPSLISDDTRSLMHHNPLVEDPYDTASVDVARLRNSLFRASVIKGFSEKAIEDAVDHLLYHAREIVEEILEKKE